MAKHAFLAEYKYYPRSYQVSLNYHHRSPEIIICHPSISNIFSSSTTSSLYHLKAPHDLLIHCILLPLLLIYLSVSLSISPQQFRNKVSPVKPTITTSIDLIAFTDRVRLLLYSRVGFAINFYYLRQTTWCNLSQTFANYYR